MQLRAPADDGAIVLAPSWREIHDQICASTYAAKLPTVDLLGMPLRALRRQARDEMLSAARAYTSQYADPVGAVDSNQPVILTGHQPELVHAGVWLKNFAAAELARDCGAIAVNLMIDVDQFRSNTVAVPSSSAGALRLQQTPLDAPGAVLPWEERKIADVQQWRSFGSRAAEAIRPLVDNPFIRQWWPDAVERGLATCTIGAGLAQARHRAELSWDRPSLQLPQSEACQTEAFRRFACHVLATAGPFRAAHNESLALYRRRRRIRNTAHPIPDLNELDDWTETPFWMWSSSDPTRRALYARRVDGELRISDRNKFNEILPLADGDASWAVQQLADWEARGIKLRSRALVTTMFSRLLVSDMFIHGIGGSKYDEVTDDIARHYLGVELAPYATLSGTLRLPIPHVRSSDNDARQLRRLLREFEYHPERHFADVRLSDAQATLADAAMRDKAEWVGTPKTPTNAAQRHQAIAAANSALAAALGDLRQSTEQSLDAAERQIRANKVLDSREYAFCLFPRNRLREFLLDFSHRLP